MPYTLQLTFAIDGPEKSLLHLVARWSRSVPAESLHKVLCTDSAGQVVYEGSRAPLLGLTPRPGEPQTDGFEVLCPHCGDASSLELWDTTQMWHRVLGVRRNGALSVDAEYRVADEGETAPYLQCCECLGVVDLPEEGILWAHSEDEA